MSDADLRAAFHAHTDGQSKLTRRMIITMAIMFGVTPKFIVQRCERLSLCKRGSWDWFVAHGGITRAQIEEVRNSLHLKEPAP